MNINNITVVPRKNRPSVLSRCALEFFYIKNGVHVDPYAGCSVSLYRDQVASSTKLATIANGDPDAYLDYESSSSRYGLISSSVVSATDYKWENRLHDGTNTHVVFASADEFDPTNYDGLIEDSSGIWKLGDGHFAVVLMPSAIYVSSTHDDLGNEYASSGEATNSASAAATYFDVWTIVDHEGAPARTYISKLVLFNDTIFAVSEPLLLSAKNTLVQKYVNVKSIVNLKIKTEIALTDQEVPADVRSIFNDSVIQDAEVKIEKYLETNEAWTNEIDWADASFVTSKDTIVYKHYFGSTGRYRLQIRYALMDELIYSDKFNLIVR